MAVLSVQVDAASRLVIVAWADVQPQLDEWREALEQVLDHPDVDSRFGIVSDRRSLTKSPSSAFVRGVVGMLSTYAAAGRFNGRWATVVAPSQLAVYGMGRMTEILGEQESVQFRVFTELEAAKLWAAGGEEPRRALAYWAPG